MVQKESLVIPVDKCGVGLVNVFHTYRSDVGQVGDFLKISVRRVLPESKLRLKGKNFAIFVRSKFRYVKLDGTSIWADYNGVVLLKKRLTPVGKELYGIAFGSVRRKKFLSSFAGVV